MGLYGRWATPDDEALLVDLQCNPNQTAYARDVERWVSELCQWMADGPRRFVRLYLDDETDELVGVVAYRDLLEGQEGSGYFIYLLAVRSSHQRARIGRGIVIGLLNQMAAEQPGQRVTWMVDPRNIASCQLAFSLGCDEPLSVPEDHGMLEFSIIPAQPGAEPPQT